MTYSATMTAEQKELWERMTKCSGDDDDGGARSFLPVTPDVDAGGRVRRNPLVLRLRRRPSGPRTRTQFPRSNAIPALGSAMRHRTRTSTSASPEVEQAQYWEDKKPKVLQFAEILVAAVTGDPPKSGDEKKLDFDD